MIRTRSTWLSRDRPTAPEDVGTVNEANHGTWIPCQKDRLPLLSTALEMLAEEAEMYHDFVYDELASTVPGVEYDDPRILNHVDNVAKRYTTYFVNTMSTGYADAEELWGTLQERLAVETPTD